MSEYNPNAPCVQQPDNVATGIYRPRTIKKRRQVKRRTGEAIEQLERQILDVLEEDHPQSVRHVFYRMTDPRLPEPVEKSEWGYRQVQDRLAKMRRAGRVPYGWISDASRRGYFVNTYSNAGHFRAPSAINIAATSGACPITTAKCGSSSDHWLASSRTIAKSSPSISTQPVEFSSMSFAYVAAESINDNCGGKPVTIFYIGDYDPAGVLIDQSIEKEFRLHIDDSVDLTFCRLGITEQQIELLDLPRKPRKEKDLRSLHIKGTVEAEAMPARIMRSMLRGAIEELLPPGALAETQDDERIERAFLRKLAEEVSS